jgi:hypothetical protein
VELGVGAISFLDPRTELLDLPVLLLDNVPREANKGIGDLLLLLDIDESGLRVPELDCSLVQRILCLRKGFLKDFVRISGLVDCIPAS